MDSRNSESFHDLHEIKNEVSMLISVICLGCLLFSLKQTGGTIAVFWIFTTVGDSYLTPSPLRHFENFEKYTYKTNQNSYFLLEFYKIKQQSESFANCFLSITVFFFVRVMLMMTFICKPLSPDALTAFLSATLHLNPNTSSPVSSYLFQGT